MMPSMAAILILFLSTLSLRRATSKLAKTSRTEKISIHALLAESDGGGLLSFFGRTIFLSTLSLRRATQLQGFLLAQGHNFYPRSPCGERHEKTDITLRVIDFYPRSPCGERPCWVRSRRRPSSDFYPRSPCGERPHALSVTGSESQFLSTLSLRRATGGAGRLQRHRDHFYPRSPCGERPWHPKPGWDLGSNFYPRSPCGERPFTTVLH